MKKRYFIYSIILALFLTNLPVANISAYANNIDEEHIVLSEEYFNDNEISEDTSLDFFSTEVEEESDIDPRVLPAIPVVVTFIATSGVRAAASKWGKSTITLLVKQQEKVARASAKDLGYKELSDISHGAKVYQRVKGSGPKFISRDKDAHKGGAWKGATTIKNLASPDTRSGTYDLFLEERVGK